MVKILLFGRLAELETEPSFSIELTDSIRTAGDVRRFLSEQNHTLGKALSEPQNLMALNQKIISDDAPISEEDELAFLPPVTGG